MRKFRKKPIVIEAERWFRLGDVPEAGIKPYSHDAAHWRCPRCGQPAEVHGIIDTLEGEYIVCPGDWIIKGIKGEFYPCKPDVFEETYEPVE